MDGLYIHQICENWAVSTISKITKIEDMNNGSVSDSNPYSTVQ